MYRIMAWVLVHIDGMPMIRVCYGKQEIKHGCFLLLGCHCIISALLKYARAISERIADRGIELCNYGF